MRIARRQLAAAHGFTLVELLVVMLIVGVLTAIVVPSFLAHRTRAQDAEAKVYVVAVEKALEVWHTEHQTYDGADQTTLAAIEPAVQRARNLSVSGTEDTYDIGIDSATPSGGGRFSLSRGSDGVVTRTCLNSGKGACPDDGHW
jgi:type IV pilus assembly protein PilA